MVSFYKYTGPVQFFSIIFLVVLLRLPVFIITPPVLSEDLYHAVLGSELSEGALLYRDIFTASSPIPAMIYWLLSEIGGNSYPAYFIFSTLLIGLQIFIFRMVMNSNELLSAKSEFPTLAYAMCSFVCLDFMSLSPALISVTFVLLALNNIFLHLRKENNEGETFATGFYIGLAYLSFAPCIIFLVMGISSFLLYTRTPPRFYALMILGFLFTILTVCVGYYLADGLDAFLTCYLLNFPPMGLFAGNFDLTLVLLMILPLFVMVFWGFLKAATYTRFINYQVISFQILSGWMFFTFWIVVLFFSKTVTSFYLLAPFASYFLSQFFILVKQNIIKNAFLVIYVLTASQFVYAHTQASILTINHINFNHQIIDPKTSPKQYQKKKILVFGNTLPFYLHAQLATPFFDADLTQNFLGKLHLYSVAEKTFDYFISDPPEIIIDELRLMPSIIERIPTIGKWYNKDSTNQHYYLKPTHER